ncbi:MAG: DMT family transporter [Firmicutes bacterium]|nr:DMT family transporter [Bacillota bacterium]MDP3043960.1 EamA family transporter [Bacillota bacterium]
MEDAHGPLINPYLAVGLGVLAVSFSSIFTKMADAPPTVIAFYRLGLATLVLLPFALRGLPLKELRSISRQDLKLAFAAGSLLALHFTVWITSLNYTSIASSTVLVTMQPLFVIAGSFLILKERIGTVALLATGLALTGSIIVGISDFQVGEQALYGDFLALMGAGFVAGYVLIGRSLRARLCVVSYTFLVYGSCTLVLLGFCLATSAPLYPYPGTDWYCFIALALIPTLLGHSVFNWALRYVKATVVSVSILGEPVGASILAYFIFAETPAMLQVLGGLVIMGGITVFYLATRQEESRPRTVGLPVSDKI